VSRTRTRKANGPMQPHAPPQPLEGLEPPHIRGNRCCLQALIRVPAIMKSNRKMKRPQRKLYRVGPNCGPTLGL
jgi:hypothetical protein